MGVPTIRPTPGPPMPLRVAELQPVLQDLFLDTADRLARASGFCRRARKLTGPVFAQALVFSLLDNPDATLDDFAGKPLPEGALLLDLGFFSGDRLQAYIDQKV